MTAGQDDPNQGRPDPSPDARLEADGVNVTPQRAATGAASDNSDAGVAVRAGPKRRRAGEGTEETATPRRMFGRQVLSASLPRVLTHVAAGLAGGMITLAGADLLFGVFGRPMEFSWVAVEDLNRRVDAIEKSSGSRAASGDLAQQVTGLQDRVSRIEETARTIGQLGQTQTKLGNDVRSLEQRLASTPSGATPAELLARLTRLEERLATLSAAAGADPQRGGIPQLAAITGKIADLKSALANQIAALRQSTAQEIEARWGPAAEASETARAGAQRLDRELAALKSDASRLVQRADALKASDDRLQEETNGVKTAIEGLKNQLGTMARRPDLEAAIAPLSNRLAALEQGLQQVTRAEEDRRANAERVLLSLELTSFKRAIERGGSYAAELGELRRLAGGRLNLGVLERYQDQGVPSQSELEREFRGLTFSIIEGDAEPPDASVVDRLISGARSIVRVRKTNQGPEDQTAEAIVARMERALKDGKLAEGHGRGAEAFAEGLRSRPAMARKGRGTRRHRARHCRSRDADQSGDDRRRKTRAVMLRLVVFLLAVAAFAAGLSWLADRPGSLLVEWQGYEIETSVFRAIVIFALIIALSIIVWSLLADLWHSPAALGEFLNRRRQERGLDALSSGMIALGAGDRSSATRYAIQARKTLPNEPLTHLLRAQAAQLSGDRITARRIFEAMLATPDTEQLGLRGLFLEAEGEGEREAARQFAERAVRLNPKLELADSRALRAAMQGRPIGKAPWRRWRSRGAISISTGRVADRRRAVLLTAQAQTLEDTASRTLARALALQAHNLAPGPGAGRRHCRPHARLTRIHAKGAEVLRADLAALAASRPGHRLCLCAARRQPARSAASASSSSPARRRIRSKVRSQSRPPLSTRTTGQRPARRSSPYSTIGCHSACARSWRASTARSITTRVACANGWRAPSMRRAIRLGQRTASSPTAGRRYRR